MSDCIFCKIANGEIPTNMVYEDEKIAAFRDLEPQAPEHVLIVPKKHIQSLDQTGPKDAELLAHIMLKIKEIAKILDSYIPNVEKMHTQVKRYSAAAAENKKLKKKNARLEKDLEAAQDKGVLKKLEEAKLRQSYEAAVELLDRIPPEIIRAYTGKGVHRRRSNEIE